jgi:beta-1,3-galactosyltransferase 1
MKVDFRSTAMTSLKPSLMSFFLLLSLFSYSLHEVMTSRDVDNYVISRPAVDATSVTFIHNVRDLCNDDTMRWRLVAVIIVCSAVENQPERDVIRRTWGSVSSSEQHVRVVFLLGRRLAETNDTIRSSYDEAVAAESRQYGDVIQADFIDTYANLSRKSLAALRWAETYGACAEFVVKSDDDTFINTPLLVRDLGTCAHRRFVMGHVIARAQPVRDPEEKWFTPVSVYRAPAYPTYASGAAYVVSGDAVGLLLRAAKAGTQSMFWIEDVYVTGMLAKVAGVQLIVNGKFDGYRPLADVCAVRNHIVQHRIARAEMYRLWRDVTTSGEMCEHDVQL